MARFPSLIAMSLLLASPAAVVARRAPAGKVGQGSEAVRTVTVARGTALKIYDYRPYGCRVAGLLVVFHGLDRNATDYRADTEPLADRLCLVVAAPLFDTRRFPTWRYQRGGIADHGSILPASDWTVGLVAPLVAALRRSETTGDLPVYLIGHSAGAQFLSRVAAYANVDAARIVIANPSTYVMPSLAEEAPYGFFGRLPSGETMLRRYLAAPVTILLGDEDTGGKHLVENAEAMRQGATRLERGRRTFAAAAAAARERRWPFGWRLAEVPRVGHDARSMLASDQAMTALSGLAGIPPRSPSD